MGRLDVTLDSTGYASAGMKHAINFAARSYYHCSIDIDRGRFHRYLRRRYVNTFFQAHHSQNVLHTGTFDLPLPSVPPGTRHFLFCDSTWDLWRRVVPSIHFYSPKLLADAERLEEESYRQMSHVFTISEYVRRNLIEHFQIRADRITVVGTGRGAIQPYTGPKDYGNRTILFVAKGRFEDKGCVLLLEALKLARQREPRLHLIVVGDERSRKYAEGIPNVEVHGFVALETLQSFFNRAALFAMPALNEPWGLVFLEALSCKTPILGLNRNAMPEITQHGRFGFCIDDATPAGVAAGLVEAFQKPDRLACMGAEGQDYCLRTFTWENTVKRIVEGIDNCDARAGRNHN